MLLVPAVEPGIPHTTVKGKDIVETGPARRLEQTGLDGSFVVSHVQPGSYYVVAEKTGYLPPLSIFTREQLNKPDEETAKLMARLLTPVTVTANHSTAVEVHIQRGASLSGSVLYDDGSPASGVIVRIWQRS